MTEERKNIQGHNGPYNTPIVLPSKKVLDEWIDYNGHMNVVFYTLAFDNSLDFFLEEILGIGKTHAIKEKQGPFVLQAHYHYLNEMSLNEEFNVRLLVVDCDQKRMHLCLDIFSKKQYIKIKPYITLNEEKQLKQIGDPSIHFHKSSKRIYLQHNLFSHLTGFKSSELKSKIERNLDHYLKEGANISLTLDLRVQHKVHEELARSLKLYNANSAVAIIMDVNNGEILSLVSLPDFNINLRENNRDTRFLNKITKGVYELGSIFKTFTVALALDNNLVTPETIIKDIPKSVKCSKYNISDIKDFPKRMSVEDILIRSSNIGTLLIARKIGEEKYKKFIEASNLLKIPDIQLEEVGKPTKFNWNKCKLETVSYGHGITTTPLQATAVYAALTNGGKIIRPNLVKNEEEKKYFKRLCRVSP